MASIFSVDTLKAEINNLGGFAKNNKFSVVISAPSGIPALRNNGMLRRLSFFCDTVSLPTKSLATFEKTIYGPVKAMPYRMTFTEASMSFYLSDEMPEKKYFDFWQDAIVSTKSGLISYYDDYVSDITISKFSNSANNTNEQPTYAIKLLDAWPSIVAEIQLSHSGGSEAMKLPVTFQYRKWEPLGSGFSVDFGGTRPSTPPTRSGGGIG